MASSEFATLSARVARLKKQFLPPLRPTANYTPAEQDNIRALRLLVHAEIESYLEQICTKLAEDLERELLGHKVPKPVKSWGEEAVRLCKLAISSNNGVNDDHIRKMFRPLGFLQEHYDEVSPTFLSTMRTFGKNRGTVAHNSPLRVAHGVTRQGDEKLINEILKMLKSFDAILIKWRLQEFMR